MADLEVIALDTVTPQLKAPQAGDGYAMPRPVTVTEVVGSTALTLTGATQTTSQPVFNATQTWNNVATTFTGLKFNATDTTSAAASLLADLQVGSVSRFNVRKDGTIFLNSVTTAGDIGADSGGRILINSGGTGSGARITGTLQLGNADLILSRKAAASLQIGAADAAAPVAQTIGVQSVIAGTSNTAGQNLTVRGSQGTGTGVGGSLLFQTAPAGGAGTAQNALVTQVTVAGSGGTTLTEVVGSTALTLTGATQTASTPVLNATQTWNNVATTFTGLKFNATDTTSAAASLLMDLQVGGVGKFQARKDGSVQISASLWGGNNINPIWYIGGAGLVLAASRSIQWSSNGTFSSFSTSTTDLILYRKGAANLQHGDADAAAPVAQTIGVQSVVAGTSNTAGANFTIRGSQGTGTGVGGNIIFQVAPAGTAGTAQNALATALTVYNTKTVAVGVAFTVATLPAAGTQGRRAWVTDAVLPTFRGALTGGGAVVCPVFDNGTAWVSG